MTIRNLKTHTKGDAGNSNWFRGSMGFVRLTNVSSTTFENLRCEGLTSKSGANARDTIRAEYCQELRILDVSTEGDQTKHHLYLKSCQNILVERCSFAGTGEVAPSYLQYGIYVDGNCRDIHVRKTRLVKSTVVISGQSSRAIKVLGGAHNIHFDEIAIMDDFRGAVEVDTDLTTGVKDFSISGYEHYDGTRHPFQYRYGIWGINIVKEHFTNDQRVWLYVNDANRANHQSREAIYVLQYGASKTITGIGVAPLGQIATIVVTTGNQVTLKGTAATSSDLNPTTHDKDKVFTIRLQGNQQNWLVPAQTVIRFFFDGAYWYEISRSVTS